MKILLVGDCHADLGPLLRYPRELAKAGEPVDGMIQLGDFGFWRKSQWEGFLAGQYRFRVPTLAIPGNHEDPAMVAEAVGPHPARPVENFRLLGQGEIVSWLGLTVMGVGSAPCVDNPSVRFPYDPEDFLRALSAWERAGSPPIDLLLTHECPYDVGLMGDPRIARIFNLPPNQVMGEARLRQLWEAVSPRWQINGHHHRWNFRKEGSRRHLALPVGQEGYAILDTDTWGIERREC